MQVPRLKWTEFVIEYQPGDPLTDYLYRLSLCNLHSFTRNIAVHSTVDSRFTHEFRMKPGVMIFQPDRLADLDWDGPGHAHGGFSLVNRSVSGDLKPFPEEMLSLIPWMETDRPEVRGYLENRFNLPQTARSDRPVPNFPQWYVKTMRNFSGPFHDDSVFPFSTDGIPTDLPETCEEFVSVCSGLKMETIVYQTNAKRPIVTYADCSARSVDWRWNMLENWDGRDYLGWIDATARPYIYEGTEFARRESTRHLERFPSETRWLEFWNWYRRAGVFQFEIVDYVRDVQKFVNLIQPGALVWVTNAFFCQSTLIKYGAAECQRAWNLFGKRCQSVDARLYSNALQHVADYRDGFDALMPLFELAGPIGLGSERTG